MFEKRTEINTSKPGMTVYLNREHASISFDDGPHLGFYPNVLGYKIPSGTSCSVLDDRHEKITSELNDGLRLHFYPTPNQLKLMKDRALELEKRCNSGEERYSVFWSNCVDFVDKVILASGVKVNFRDAFFRNQLLSRPGLATVYSAFT